VLLLKRFGRNADNMRQAVDFFSGDKKIKNRNLKGILLSSARSWLFNQVVSARVSQGSWQQLQKHEPANLHATNSVFQTSGDSEETHRLTEFDIHPTAPMWGSGMDEIMMACPDGLEHARLDYQRRALRSVVKHMDWSIAPKLDRAGLMNNCLILSFELIRGQFATSVLRELVNVE